ncbi:hypothetical protein Sjap_020964 [Stephania japonica]|uniref:Uncharacterized protein n=1 Tax=Stephania japonica TaxID=461633 RepID=A0AAP0I0U8_9MAGN
MAFGSLCSASRFLIGSSGKVSIGLKPFRCFARRKNCLKLFSLFFLGACINCCCRFSPEGLSLQFMKGLLGWFLQFVLLKVVLFSLSSGHIVDYAGYAFTGMCVAVLGSIVWSNVLV